jgi:hypothetical protein
MLYHSQGMLRNLRPLVEPPDTPSFNSCQTLLRYIWTFLRTILAGISTFVRGWLAGYM